MEPTSNRVNSQLVPTDAIVAYVVSIGVLTVSLPKFELNVVERDSHAQPGPPVDPTACCAALIHTKQVHEVAARSRGVGI